MADLFKIKAGDTLKIPVEVTYADNAAGAPVRIVGDFMSTLVDGREEFWLPRSTVEAAEHIPAPRVFKRGDWVQYDDQRHGWVNCVRGGDVLVAWPEATQLFAYTPEELEPDEAPE